MVAHVPDRLGLTGGEYARMQLLYGVLGPEPRATAVMEHLDALTRASSPSIELRHDSARGLRIGHHLRSFARWDGPGGDLTILLDGEVRLIDGRDTIARGSSAWELAQIAALYRQHGRGTWDRLDGSFCLLIRDGDRLRVGFDVAGTRALYWWASEDTVAFHSHLLDLAPAWPGELRVDPAGVASFLAHSFYPLSATVFLGMSLVGAGQVLEIDPADGGLHARAVDAFRYVSIPGRPDRPTEALADELAAVIKPAVARCWRAADLPVVPLSGGVDSRYLAASLVRAAGDPSLVPTITWGEDPARSGSDAVIAPLVAAALGVPHRWYDKPQPYAVETLQRAIYLTSGEGDGVLNFPGDHEFHERLVAERGFRSLFRGDHAFGQLPRLLTMHGVFASAGLSRIRLDPTYRAWLDAALLDTMADAQDALFERWMAMLESPTPQGRLYELKYELNIRREVTPYNTLKNAHFEVYTPLMDRQILDWVRRLPDHRRVDKRDLRMALTRQFPELASIPLATSNNLPDWDARATCDPSIARGLLDLCDGPGWLDAIGAKAAVVAELEMMEIGARIASSRAPTGRDGAVGRPGTDGRLTRLLRYAARSTVPGRIVRERTMERRAVSDRSTFNRLSRLAIVHALVGQAETRHAQSRSGNRLVEVA